MSDKITVLIADDHTHERLGFIELLRYADSIEVVGEAESARQAVQMATELRPNVILLDLEWFKDASAGSSAIRQIKAKAPQVKILAATVHPQLLDGARRAGAEVAVDKDSLHNSDTLIARVEDAAATELLPVPDHANAEELTPREYEVLTHIVAGHQNSEIASQLSISESTVKKHVRHVLAKLGVTKRTEAAVLALKRGIV